MLKIDFILGPIGLEIYGALIFMMRCEWIRTIKNASKSSVATFFFIFLQLIQNLKFDFDWRGRNVVFLKGLNPGFFKPSFRKCWEFLKEICKN